ncbi:hypothetical protein JB92DRAFT_1574797 [Gautieria morchelliformis]|nr:hypothetical protein JB92DRAFT_1574797 [Gautieria morchelliformis]
MAALGNLGIVANVIAVIQLTGVNIGACYYYGSGVKNASRNRERIIKELVGLWVVLKQVSRLVKDERGETSRLETSSRLLALNDLLRHCGGEMRSLRAALSGETVGTIEVASEGNVESIEMGRLEAATDNNMESIETSIQVVLDGNMDSIQAALHGDMKTFLAVLEKHLGHKSGMQGLMWPLKEADLNKTVDSIGKLQGLLMNAMGIDQIHLTLEIDTGVKALDEKAAKMIQSVDEAKLCLDSAKLEMRGGLEALKGQSVGIKESMELADRHIGEFARTVLEIQDELKVLKEQSTEINQSVKQHKLQEHRQKIYKWLGAPDHESKHRNARRMRQESTGEWFVEGEHFQEWREAPCSFLWLHGIPGAGKTILCSTIIEQLSLHCRSDPSLAMAFFYFDFNNKDTLPNAVLRSLIKQLSVQCANTPHALESLFSTNEQGGAHRDPGQEDLMSTLKTIISSFQAVYIVFDALDECPERSRFLMVIRDIHGWDVGQLHLLATSRKERAIEEGLSGLISQEVLMDENLVDGDIRVHVSRTLEDDIKFRMCSAGEKEMVMTTLIDGAHGMFRWVVCQLDALRKCRTPAALEKALMSLPKTLNQTYDQILAAIDEDDRRDALSLLQWLAFSVGTISMDEAVEVLATDPDAREGPLFDRRRRLRDPGDILTICSSLVTITFREDLLFIKPGEIRLAHFSVREYLISEHLRTSTTVLSYYYFNEKMAHVFIAKTCLAYLLQFDQDNGVNLNTARSYPLSHYAASNWMHHAGWDPAGDWDDLHGLIMTLLELTSAVYVNWMWLYWQSRPWESCGMNPLYVVAATGLE